MVFYGLTCDCCTRIDTWHNSYAEAADTLATLEREVPEYRDHFSVVSVDFSTGELTVYETCAGCADG